MRDIHQQLINGIASGLRKAEESGDIIICSATSDRAVSLISNEVREVFTSDVFSPEELLALSGLIFHAVADKRFYDWEMPTLIGYTADDLAELGERIRQLSTL
ncbi:hypothetical protein ABB30_00010 [Stenotrophomonas ginsengisoli]|uniref:Uncharacterized protein n=1 Tax=Stenotrophomonas ginsengisoli TaxID=336566 RepID=A0A0R0DLS1_9GAMM|nr:hypothetical protein [Stenotrophomonas ginsengisoli]KRG79698.1 hypothetical protein ABB30_00010 [Stenotrophomonas ginsengisoli]